MDDFHADDYLAAAAMTFIGLTGIVINITEAILLFRVPTLNCCFGIMNASHMIANSGILFHFVLWAAPAAFLHPTEMANSRIANYLGQTSCYFFFTGLYSHLLMSLNRFVAVCYPGHYKSVFRCPRVFLFIATPWICGFFHAAIYFFPTCFVYFDLETFLWTYAETTCGHAISLYNDLIAGMTICCLIFMFDLISLTRLRNVSKVMGRTSSTRDSRNIRFFLQTFSNGVLLCLTFVSFHWFSTFSRSKWIIFFFKMIVWESFHASPGLIYFIFCKELRKAVKLLIFRKRRFSATDPTEMEYAPITEQNTA